MSGIEPRRHTAPVAQPPNLRSLARGLRRTETYFRLMAKIYPRKRQTYRELATPCGEAAAVLEMSFRKDAYPADAALLNGNPEATSRALRARREELRLGRPELANRSGVSRGTIRNLECGICIPTTQTLERLIKALYPEGDSAPSTDLPHSLPVDGGGK